MEPVEENNLPENEALPTDGIGVASSPSAAAIPPALPPTSHPTAPPKKRSVLKILSLTLLGLIAVFAKQRNGLLGRLGDLVVKRCRNHASPAALMTALTML